MENLSGSRNKLTQTVNSIGYIYMNNDNMIDKTSNKMKIASQTKEAHHQKLEGGQ
jgi:hypothetical protein